MKNFCSKKRFILGEIFLVALVSLILVHPARAQESNGSATVPAVLKDYVSCQFSAEGKPAGTVNGSQFVPPKDVLCSFSLLEFKEASDIFGKRIATTYVVIQVVVRNLNQKNDFLLHDVQVQVPGSQFRAGRDKLLARGVSIKGQTMDTRNMIMGGLDTLSATAGAISLIGAAGTPVTAAFQGLSNGNNVLTAFLPPLKRWFPDYTVDQLNRLNDLGFSASSNYKIIVPKGGAIPFVTFIPQQLFDKPVRKWSAQEFLTNDDTTYVLVAGALIQELTNAPSITSLSPASGPAETPVTITGTNFGDTQGSSGVKFGGSLIESLAPGSIKSWSATSIVVTVPPSSALGLTPVVVSVNNMDSASTTFTVTPSVTSLTPTSGPPGTSVTISGENFGATQGTVKFGSTTAPVTSWSDGSIVVTVPNVAAGSANVVATVNRADSPPAAFTVTSPPSVSSLSPTSGPTGISITISGANFGAAQGTGMAVKFGATTAPVTSWSPGSIVVTVPNVGPGTANVVVSVNNMDSAPATFTVSSPPSITTLSPNSGAPGASVTINGANFGATEGIVKFGATTAPVTSWSPASIVVTVPNVVPGTANVVVSVNSMGSAPATFTVSSPLH